MNSTTNEELFRNVILMIGDGNGVGHLNATRISLGPGDILYVDTFPLMDFVETYSQNNPVTDSAAAGTALACGLKTWNGIVAMTSSGMPLLTILEWAESQNKSTGLVTTTRLTHATPACFAAHVLSRSQEANIAAQMLTEHEIEVLLGGGRTQLASLLDDAVAAGYTLIENRSQLLGSGDAAKLLGVFSDDHMSYDVDRNPLLEPSLAEMTNITLQSLVRDVDGFFLMVEGGRIDHAAHNNDIDNVIGDGLAFNEAVGVALEFAEQDGETLLIVVADHETGGLIVNTSSPDLDYQWTTTGHTANMVPAYIYCSNTTLIPDFSHLVDIGQFLFTALAYTTTASKNNSQSMFLAEATCHLLWLREQYRVLLIDRICFPDA